MSRVTSAAVTGTGGGTGYSAVIKVSPHIAPFEVSIAIVIETGATGANAWAVEYTLEDIEHGGVTATQVAWFTLATGNNNANAINTLTKACKAVRVALTGTGVTGVTMYLLQAGSA